MTQPLYCPGSTATDMSDMLRRLKLRLALADFKRKHGYEKYDLGTLETSLFRVTKRYRGMLRPLTPSAQHHHRYYPTSPVSDKQSVIKATYMLHPATLLRSPLSAKRNTPPRVRQLDTLSPSPWSSPNSTPSPLQSDDEDAANLLVMLHNMA